MAEKVLYELYAGNAPGLALENGNVVDLVEGDTVETEMRLDKMWPAKFVAVDRTDELLGAAARRRKSRLRKSNRRNTVSQVAQPTQLPPHAQDEDEGAEENTEVKAQVKDLAKEPKSEPRTRAQEADKGGEEGDEQDHSEDFELAVQNDLKVTHVKGEGYTIRDGRKSVTDKPLRTRTQVEAKLKEYTEE
jgi:hypothetical protein